jgi:5-methylcytosine-specific restriction enzyme subunit McrC
MNIPIQNIYYMLCYAWDALEQIDSVPREITDSPNFYELLTRVLCRSIRPLERVGLDRGYQTRGEATSQPSGKIVFSESLKPKLFLCSKLYCEKDELTTNLVHNQIVKTTLFRLRMCSQFDRDLRGEIASCLDVFKEVDFIDIQSNMFGAVLKLVEI